MTTDLISVPISINKLYSQNACLEQLDSHETPFSKLPRQMQKMPSDVNKYHNKGPNISVTVSGRVNIQSMNINFNSGTQEISPEIQAHINSQKIIKGSNLNVPCILVPDSHEMMISPTPDISPGFNKQRRQTTKSTTTQNSKEMIRKASISS